jgi:hypothetical protein
MGALSCGRCAKDAWQQPAFTKKQYEAVPWQTNLRISVCPLRLRLWSPTFKRRGAGFPIINPIRFLHDY